MSMSYMRSRQDWLEWEPKAVMRGRRAFVCSWSKWRNIPWTILSAACCVGSSLKLEVSVQSSMSL